MRLVALVESTDHVCYRYRAAAYESALAERGWEIEPWAIAHGGLGRFLQFQRAGRADAVLLQRRLLSPWHLAWLRRQTKVLLYDFDDAIYLRDCGSKKKPECNQRLLKFWATISAADGIACGNPRLVARAASYVDRKRVTLIPTVVDPSRYLSADHLAEDRQRRPFRVGWIGSQSTMRSLHEAQDGLRKASQRIPGLEFHVICDAAPDIPGVKVVARPWSSQTEARDLADTDVGLSWLPDHPWSWGKCGLKVLQYQAAGLPVIGNAIGEHLRMIGDGTHGHIVRGADGLATALVALASDAQRRAEMGEAGRRQVESDYSVSAWSGRFADWVDHTHRRVHGLPIPEPKTTAEAARLFTNHREAA
jgi:glycosyltransferase involved in cell wall biosynthesis